MSIDWQNIAMAKRYKAKIRPGVGGAPKGTVPWNKGKKREVTWGANISAALKGREILWKDKIGVASAARTHSVKSRLKISVSRLGSVPWNKGLRKATHPDLVKGGHPNEKHWNWKGGKSKESVRIRQSSEYKAWRDAVFRRDDWTCVLCGKRGGYLEADHIKQFSIHIEERFNVENGRTLCMPCHKKVTGQQRKDNVARRDKNCSTETQGSGSV
jgi:hypothetical protein